MLIDPKMLSQEALDALIKEYCLRDWGLNETEQPLNERVTGVKAALMSGSLVIQYSEEEETAYIVSAESLGMR